MVWSAPRRSFRLDSCCSVDVMKGAGGCRLTLRFSTLRTSRDDRDAAKAEAPSDPRSSYDKQTKQKNESVCCVLCFASKTVPISTQKYLLMSVLLPKVPSKKFVADDPIL